MLVSISYVPEGRRRIYEPNHEEGGVISDLQPGERALIQLV